MQEKKITSTNVDDNMLRKEEAFISETYKQIIGLREDIINSNLTIEFLRARLKQFGIKVPRALDVISESVIDAFVETNFVSTDNRIEDLEQIAKNATFELNSLKDIIKIQKDKIKQLQDILDQNLSNKIDKIEQNNERIETLSSQLKKLNVQLSDDLTKKSEIQFSEPNNLSIDTLDIQKLGDILKQKSTQINNLQEIIKKQDNQITKLTELINKKLPTEIKQKNIEIENLNKIVKNNNKKIEMLVSELKELNIQLSSDLTKKSEIPAPKFGDYSPETILKIRSDQINNLQEIIKKQDNQITQLIGKELSTETQHKNIEIENLNKTVKDNNKKIEMLVSELKELNIQLSSDLTKKSEIPAPKFGDYSPETILKIRSDQINNLQEIIKKQDNQITQLSAELDSIKSNLVEQAKEKYSQLTSLKQVVEKNNRKIEFFINLFKSNKYLELPKDLVATSKIEDFKLEFDEKEQDVVKFYSDVLQRYSLYVDVIKKQNDQINKLKDITSQTIENLYECDTISFRALSITEVRETMNLQNLTVNAENEKHLTQQLINNYKLNPSDVIKLENMAKDILNDEKISFVINQFNTDKKKFFKTKIESDNARYDDWFYNKNFLWSDLIDLIDNKNGMETYDILQKIHKNSDYDTDIFDISEYPLFLFAYLISMSDNYQEYSEIINRMVANNKDLEKIFNALQSIIVIADPNLTKDRTMLNEIGCADQKLIDFSSLCKRAQFITAQYFNNISSNIESMQDKCRLDEYKNDIKSAKNIDNEISELEEKENEIRKAKLLNNIIKLKYKDTEKSITLDELINGISYNSAAVYQLKKSDRNLLNMLDDELNKFKYAMNNKINEANMKQCANSAKNNFINSEEFNNLKTEDKLYQNLISENQNLMTRYSDQDKINDIEGNKMLINILKKELGLGDIKKRNLFDKIIKNKNCEPDCFNIDKLGDQILDSEDNNLQINNDNSNGMYNQNKISNDEPFPFEDGNNNNKVDEMSQELVENPFQDINNDNSFKVEFSQVMNLKQNNVDTKQSLLDKVNSAQSNSNIPDMNNDADDKFPFV